ncbi:MAG: Cytochrome [Rubritepida sp.]|nr:Cytochrome [Rubritepida sp.]
MSDHPVYEPPRPARHVGRLPLTELLARARRSLLEVWNEGAFRNEVVNTKVLHQRIFVFNMPAAIEAVFVTQLAGFERKLPQLRHTLEPLLGDGLLISDGPVWKARRPPVQAVTHASRMAGLTPEMTRTAVEWRADWSARPDGTPIDALEEMDRFTAGLLGRTIFGSALTSEAAAELSAAFALYEARVGRTDLISMLGLTDFLPRIRGFGSRGEVRRIHGVVDRLIGVILDGKAGETSLVAAMAGAPGMTRGALRNEAVSLFVAGHQTMANTLAWAWFLLSEAPWAEAALHAELDAVLGGRDPAFEDLPELPYTRAVIEETLRLYPPLPLLARRAPEDTEVTGIDVPQGSIVMVSPWIVHRHERHWEAPDEFRPERFLPDAPPPAPYTYLPFSLGPRICTGQHFGLQAAMICLATLGARFRLRGVAGQRAFPTYRLTLRPGESLPMILERR